MGYIEDTNLIEEIKSLKITVGGKNIFPDEARESVLRIISEQPTADVDEVTHGEWKKISVASKEYGYGQVYYQHSSCKISPTELYQSPYERCPRCGAKMDGERKKP